MRSRLAGRKRSAAPEPGLSLADLREAEFFQNTRQFLLALQEQGGTVTTATGNLNRLFVRHMLDRVALSPLRRQDILRMNKVLNEQDLWVLHVSRLVSEMAGLIRPPLQALQAHQTRRRPVG